MTAFLVSILVAIIIMAILTLTLIISGSNDLKCPKCGASMEFIGNVMGIEEEDKIFNIHHKHPAYKHIYKCPKCGKEYVI